MTLKALSRSLDEVKAYLPFDVDDFDRANEAFLRWRQTRSDRDLQTVELWLFVYSRRYFITKFLRERALNPADIEKPIGDAYRRAREHFDEIEHPERFVNFVSVVCKHTFVNFVRSRSRSRAVELDPDVVPEAAAETVDPTAAHDRRVLRYVLLAAVNALPDSLRGVARMRLLEGREYEEIAEEVGKTQAVVRTYVSKALAKLRGDPALIEFLERETRG